MGFTSPLLVLLSVLVMLGAAGSSVLPAGADLPLPAAVQEAGVDLPLPAADQEEAQQKHFDGYTVLRAVPTSPEDLELLKSIAADDNSQVDFWLEPTQENRPVDMMVKPELKELLESRLKQARVPYSALIDDVEKAVQEENSGAGPELSQSFLPGPQRAPAATYFVRFQPLNAMHGYMDQLAAANPKIASIFSIGRSTNGRDLKGIKIGKASGSKKPAVWIDGGIHAREWISSSTVLFIANELVQAYGSDANVTRLVDVFDWYILPMSNPDGYEYTHTNNRMWRKTRSVTQGCYGTDPNRNFGFHWNEGGASNNPCSDTYAGTKAFSEPETRAIADFVLSRKDDIKIFLTVHAYSQLWLTPWGWTSAYPKDYEAMRRAADVAVNALTKLHGTRYRIGTSTNVLYVASGGSDDWAHGAAGIKYAYTLELRDTGRYGFVLPTSHIVPTGQETWEGVKALAVHVQNELK